MKTALICLSKKIVSTLIIEPEKAIKYIFLGIFIPMFLFVMMFFAPIYIISSIPSLLLKNDDNLNERQLEVVNIYQKVPKEIDKKNLTWIDLKKEEYKWADTISVSYNYNLTWQNLLALDTILLKQDFKKANRSDIFDLGEHFIKREVIIEEYGNNPTKIKAIISITTKDFEEVLNDTFKHFTQDEKNIALNIHYTLNNTSQSIDAIVPENQQSEGIKYCAGSSIMPYFNQGDKRWGNLSYGNSTVKKGGCAPTCMAMVVAGLTGNTNINPKIMADWSYEHGYKVDVGTSWGFLTSGAKAYGVNGVQIPKSAQEIRNYLSRGNPIIASMKRGHFTKGGHFIVLKGMDQFGNIIVNDPASIKRSNQTWDLNLIMNESKGFWVYSI